MRKYNTPRYFFYAIIFGGLLVWFGIIPLWLLVILGIGGITTTRWWRKHL